NDAGGSEEGRASRRGHAAKALRAERRPVASVERTGREWRIPMPLYRVEPRDVRGRRASCHRRVSALSLDVRLCHELVERSLAGDQRAATSLVEYLWPRWLEMVRTNRSMSVLKQSDDDVRNVATRLVEKITRRNGQSLELFV